jgi:sulfopyruvate decarboxylase subunit alpha
VKRADIRLVASLPDDWVIPLLDRLDADPEITLVSVAREAEIPAVCAGAWFGGIRAMGVMGIAGLLATGHELTTLNFAHQIPLLILASKRGSREDARTYQVGQGLVRDAYLDALRVPHETIDKVTESDLIDSAYRRSLLVKSAYVLLLTKQVLMGNDGS